jgi:hypothetical protein
MKGLTMSIDRMNHVSITLLMLMDQLDKQPFSHSAML